MTLLDVRTLRPYFISMLEEGVSLSLVF
jgi:hypothetical protein